MIETHYFWTVVALLMIGTICIRGSIIAASARVQIPERVREMFSYIPAAILPAFIIPSAFYHHGQVAWLGGKERLAITIAAALLCLGTRSTVLTIAFGLITLYAVTQF